MTIKCQLKHDNKILKVKLMSRAGRAKGKYQYEYNTVDENGQIIVIDFKNHVSDMYIIKDPVSEELEEEIINLTSLSTDQKDAAKLEELASWKEHNVYEEVPDEKQHCVSVRWVLKENRKTIKYILKPDYALEVSKKIKHL